MLPRLVLLSFPVYLLPILFPGVYFLFPYKNIRKHGSLGFLMVYLFESACHITIVAQLVMKVMSLPFSLFMWNILDEAYLKFQWKFLARD